MKYYFGSRNKATTKLAYEKLGANNPLVSAVERFLPGSSFSSQEEYARIVSGMLSLIREHPMSIDGTELHSKEIGPIQKGVALTEKTLWGGVSLKNVDVAKDFIRKLLVVNGLGVLGFEYHDLKLEKLKVLEGYPLVIFSNHSSKGWKEGKLSWKISAPGDRFTFLPSDEHGIIALTNSVIEETSTNHLDDLRFIYRC